MTIQDLIEKLVGKPFEIECCSIKVHGMLDHHPPLFEGPGIIRGDNEGKISFRMHNQISTSPEALSSLNWFRKDGKGLEPTSQVRFVADDYEGVSWSGAWSIPQTIYARGSQSIIAGSFDQLTTRIPKTADDKQTNATELIYGYKLKLPLSGTLLPSSGTIESFKVKDGEVLSREILVEGQDIDFKGAKISIIRNDAKTRTHIIAEKREGFKPPLVENWIRDAVIFVTACLVYPRLTIRHFEKDALIFLRAYPLDTRTGMPPPARPWYWAECWELFTLYLAKCEESQQFESIDLTLVFQEVIIASTGTVQAFVLSLALCIENLIGQLSDGLDLEVADMARIKELRQYVQKWQGDEAVKSRALGLLSMLGTKSTSAALNKLESDGTIEAQHIQAWKKIRPILAHGGIIKDPFDPIFWQSRNLLIDMTYKLIYRLIGYHGTAHWLDKFAEQFDNEEESETHLSQPTDQPLDQSP
jgi:hypothetical protein